MLLKEQRTITHYLNRFSPFLSLSFSVIWSMCSRDGEAVVVGYGVWFVILHLFGPGPDAAAFAQAGHSSGGSLCALCANHNPYVLVAPTQNT